MVIDDTAYVLFARHLAEHPGDPYGFEIMWGERPEPAMAVLLPPVLPYWLAGALSLFGDHPALWKLSLLPFALALTCGAWLLLRRFAAGLEVPLTWMLALSPAVAPSLNLMLDVPALGLSLASLALFAAAADRASPGLASASGLLLGVALETKYTAATGLGAVALYALWYRRAGLGSLAVAAAAAVFLGWEAFVSLHHGESHFLRHLLARDDDPAQGVAVWAVGLLSLLGAAAPALGLLALAALGVRRSLVAAAGLGVVGVFGALPFLPAEPVARFEMSPDLANPRPELVLFVGLGLGVAACGLVALSRALRPQPGVDPRAARFLICWVALELAGFFLVSPFLALRRVLGLGAALTVALGHLASRGGARAPDRRTLRGVAGLGCALGLLFGVSDLLDARARLDAQERASQRLRELGADPQRDRLWFLGHWGFQFYAEREGMLPLVAGVSQVRPGDWVLVPNGVLVQSATLPAGALRNEAGVVARSPWPWSTLPNAYAGAVPIRGQPRTQQTIVLRRVLVEAVPFDPTAPR